MTIGTMYAITRLKKAKIYCISPPRVNVWVGAATRALWHRANAPTLLALLGTAGGWEDQGVLL
jgi:hypothetical protein